MVESLGKQNCPDCEVPLTTRYVPGGAVLVCSICQGTSVGYHLLLKTTSHSPETHFWRTLQQGTESTRKCPACSRSLRGFSLVPGSQNPVTSEVALDGCSNCALIWFDPLELEKLKRLPPDQVPRDSIRQDSYRSVWSARISGLQMVAMDLKIFPGMVLGAILRSE